MILIKFSLTQDYYIGALYLLNITLGQVSSCFHKEKNKEHVLFLLFFTFGLSASHTNLYLQKLKKKLVQFAIAALIEINNAHVFSFLIFS